MGILDVPLKKEQLDHLAEVISELEHKTSGEMRLMIVRQSAPYNHIRYFLWAVIFALVMFVLWIERHMLIWVADWWLVPTVALSSFLLACLLAPLPAVVRAFTPSKDMADQALKRAELEFYLEGLGATKGQTGILLFISLLEHQAVVLADKGIASHIDNSKWSEVVKTMLEAPRSGNWEEHLEKALRQCGEVLSRYFPAQAENSNELPNHVIVKR